MSYSAVAFVPHRSLLAQPVAGAVPHWPLITAAAVIGLVFFVTGNDLNISLAEAYTQDAEQMEIAAAGGNALRRVAFFILGGFGMLLFMANQRAFSELRVDPWLAGSIGLSLGLAGISFFWADDPAMCRRRLLVLACCTIAVGGIAFTLDLKQMSWLAVLTLGGLAIVGVLAELRLGTFRPWAGDYRFAGTLHPNTQGPNLATLCLAAFGLARASTRWRLWLCIVCIVAFAISGLAAALRRLRATGDPCCTLPLGLLIFALINAGLESGMVVVNLVPFLLGCCLMRLALFRNSNA